MHDLEAVSQCSLGCLPIYAPLAPSHEREALIATSIGQLLPRIGLHSLYHRNSTSVIPGRFLFFGQIHALFFFQNIVFPFLDYIMFMFCFPFHMNVKELPIAALATLDLCAC